MHGSCSIVLTAGLIIVTGLVSQASAECLTAKGKIRNNAQQDGTTLGTVALNLDKQKLKCGIIGVPQFPSPPNFRHTIVCDDQALPGEAQAQVTFNTSFVSAPTNFLPCPPGSPGGDYSFSFEEISFPDPNTARGAFQGILGQELGSSITITGDFNCDGGIRMDFNGLMCFSD